MAKYNDKEPFYGFKREENPSPYILVYEIWENFQPDKIAIGDFKKYIPGLLSKEQLNRMIPFWIDGGKNFLDPIMSLQLEKNGGSTVLYRYSGRKKEEVPPNAHCRIVKPIFEKGIEKLTVMEEPGKSFVFHTSVNSKTFKQDILYFISIIEKIVFTEVLDGILSAVPEMKVLSDEKASVKNFDKDQLFLSNTYILDRRVNKK